MPPQSSVIGCDAPEKSKFSRSNISKCFRTVRHMTLNFFHELDYFHQLANEGEVLDMQEVK